MTHVYTLFRHQNFTTFFISVHSTLEGAQQGRIDEMATWMNTSAGEASRWVQRDNNNWEYGKPWHPDWIISKVEVKS